MNLTSHDHFIRRWLTGVDLSHSLGGWFVPRFLHTEHTVQSRTPLGPHWYTPSLAPHTYFPFHQVGRLLGYVG